MYWLLKGKKYLKMLVFCILNFKTTLDKVIYPDNWEYLKITNQNNVVYVNMSSQQ